MAFLLDTNVISELRKRARRDRNVDDWRSNIADREAFVSAVTMMEIRRGILSLRSRDPAQAGVLQEWYETKLKPIFRGNVLSVDLEVAEYCSVLMNRRPRALADALIAATAYVGGLTLATRNVRDFRDCGVDIVDPWQANAS
jgi:predicted nucleic acid-binding protein